jgi:hypothetical protein
VSETNTVTQQTTTATSTKTAMSVAAVAILSFAWIVIVFTAAVYLTRNTSGENVGKFVGTVFSGIAFGPPAAMFLGRYRTMADRDAAQRRSLHSSAHPEMGTAHQESSPLGPTKVSQPD